MTAAPQTYESVIRRLSQASVDKHWEPYRDIPWDDPAFLVRADDARWELPPVEPLGSHPWYLSRPPEVRARIGLWRVATAMKIGLQFENLLKRGLLNYAYRLPNGAPEFRYLYHETIEEGQHGLMFQEFVNRTGLPVRGMPGPLSFLAQAIPWIPLVSTELFFVFVLGGEEPIDHVQREILRDGRDHHPLEEMILTIHVAEEARHISFAQHYLRDRVPRMPRVRRFALSLLAPLVLGTMARVMLCPPGSMVRHFRIPRQVVAACWRRSPAAGRRLCASLGRTRRLCAELGLMNPVSRRLWTLSGISV